MTVERFPIEAGHVLTFRRAVGHEDAERGADVSSNLPVPATFVQASAQFDPDYILRPRVSAGIAQATLTATANGAARALLAEKIRSSPALYPPPDVMQRGQWPGTLPAAAQRLRDRIWTEVKAA